MDEQLNQIIIVDTTVDGQENVAYDIGLSEDTEFVADTGEDSSVIEVGHDEEILIEIGESSGLVGTDRTRHNSLYGRDEYDQHPISAITGLRNELDQIKAIGTVYSDKTGVANYYEWYKTTIEGAGHFVSLVKKTSKISICDGHDIFGVTVEKAGFIGNQNVLIPRNNSYALVVTSGLVDVQCESDVEPGDCVTSNKLGCATKTSSGRGYRVIAVNDRHGVLYASIVLGVQASITDSIGNDINLLSQKIRDVEVNVVSAVNTANDAYNKVSENANCFVSADEKAQEALDKAEQAIGVANNIGNVLINVNETATLAKTIADNAVNHATTASGDAVKRANDAWAKADKVEKESYSLCAKIDTYSVGEYSQAYGLTLEQAQNILEIGMIYAPTKHIDSETHKEQYAYGDGKVYEREFVPGYLYRWDYISGGDIDVGWVTVGSSTSVYFTHKEPVANVAYQYWYTDGDEIEDRNGSTGAYEPYTLYKWEDDHWLAVATVKGNANNRAISMIGQTVNRVSVEVTNAIGEYASLDARINNEVSQVSMVATKLMDNGEINAAAIVASVNDSESNVAIKANKIVLSGDTFFVDKDGNATTIDGSHITAGTVTANYIDSTSGNIGGFKIGEKAIYNVFNYTGDLSYFMTEPDELNSSDAYAGGYTIGDTRGYIYIGTNGIGLMNVKRGSSASEVVAQTYMSDGELFSNSADISGKITATSGEIGGLNITECGLHTGDYPTNTDSLFGVLSTSAYMGYGSLKHINNAAYNPMTTSGSSLINVYAGAPLNAGTLIDPSGNDNVPFYITQSGLVKTNNVYVKGAGLFDFDSYKTSLSKGRVSVCYTGGNADSFVASTMYGFNTIEWTTNANEVDAQIFFDHTNKSMSLFGSWYGTSSLITDSYCGVKHDIEPIDDRYSILFDNMEPVRFKYNNGQSDRYHTGFILDKLKVAMDVAEIDSSEFAAYCVRDKQTGEGGIRYEEIIALLVKEVQALKKEIKENG